MSYSYKLKSHPKKFLRNHLKLVGESSRATVNSKYMKNKNLFSIISYLIGISHDFGKSTTYFQKKLNTGDETKFANHGFVSSLFSFFIVKRYLEKKEEIKDFWYLPVIAWVVVKRHHGDIKNLDGSGGETEELEDTSSEINTIMEQMKNIKNNNCCEIEEIYSELLSNINFELYVKNFIDIFSDEKRIREFFKEIRIDAKRLSRENNIEYYVTIMFFYSVLLDSDKLDASDTKKPQRIENIPDNIVGMFKKNFDKTKEINRLREDAYNHAIKNIENINLHKNKILSLELPTGLGKTILGFSVAVQLRNRIKKEVGFCPKIIYSLPFLSIIDQNSKVIESILKKQFKGVSENLLIKHHHLAPIKYQEGIVDTEFIDMKEELDVHRAVLLTESWHSEIIVTTFVQLFESLITNRNRSARKFHNIVNSIIILDEIQSIPTEYWSLVKDVMNILAKNFNCYIILMTATKPLIFESEVITELIKNKSNFYENLDRNDYYFILDEMSLENLAKNVMQDIGKNKKDVMCILNTIGSCKKLYKYLKSAFKGGKINEDGVYETKDFVLINLSTHIIPKDRLKRIELIRSGKRRKIIITTQLVEAGVDITVDKIYRDLAPLDCIIQSAGRCNREDTSTKGMIQIIKLKDDKTNKFFYSFVYDSTLIDITKNILEKNEHISENKIKEIIENYYSEVKSKKSTLKSLEILASIESLKFLDISKFNLIEKMNNRIEIIIELDNEAKTIIEKLSEIRIQIRDVEKEEVFSLREEIKKNKRLLSQYVISPQFYRIPAEIDALPILFDTPFVKIADKDHLETIYERDSGLRILDESTNDNII